MYKSMISSDSVTDNIIDNINVFIAHYIKTSNEDPLNKVYLSLYRQLKVVAEEYERNNNIKVEIGTEHAFNIIKKVLKSINEEIETFVKGNNIERLSDLFRQKFHLEDLLPKPMSEDKMKELCDSLLSQHHLTLGEMMKELRQYNNIDMKYCSKYLQNNIGPACG